MSHAAFKYGESCGLARPLRAYTVESRLERRFRYRTCETVSMSLSDGKIMTGVGGALIH